MSIVTSELRRLTKKLEGNAKEGAKNIMDKAKAALGPVASIVMEHLDAEDTLELMRSLEDPNWPVPPGKTDEEVEAEEEIWERLKASKRPMKPRLAKAAKKSK